MGAGFRQKLKIGGGGGSREKANEDWLKEAGEQLEEFVVLEARRGDISRSRE